MKYGSVCSGVEAATLAWSHMGWECTFVSEVEPFPCAVLQHRFGASAPINPLDPNEIVITDEEWKLIDGLKKQNKDWMKICDDPDLVSRFKERKMRESWIKDNALLNKEGDIPNEGDFTKIKDKYAEKIDLLVGGTPCFVAGTMVLTPSGYVPIETLKVGDTVISGEGIERKVEAVGNKLADIGSIKIVGRPEIFCTDNHPFFCVDVKRDNRRKSPTYSQIIPVGDYHKVPAGESVGKYVGRVKVAPVVAPLLPKVYDATAEQIMELAGWYLGDGYIRKWTGSNKKAVVLCLCNQQKIDTFNERFSNVINYSVSKDGKVTIACTEFADWLSEQFGELSENKRIPYWCYSDENKCTLLRGYRNTDGCEQEKEYKFTTVSKALAYGMADLMGDASVTFTKTPDTATINGRTINQKDCYCVHFYKNTPIKTKKFKGRCASKIRSFIYAGIDTVYNITVAEDHTYIANGIYVHNCQDLSVAGKRAGFDGERSSLAIDFVELAYRSKCKWVVWENVPGVFSSNEGRDFATFLSLLTGAEVTIPADGWGTAGFVCNARRDRFGVAWRTLDGQFTRTSEFPFAVPQRRRRVFLVGYFGDWTRAAEVLLEPGRLQWDTPTRIKTRERVAETVGTDTALADGTFRGTESDNRKSNGVDAYNCAITGEVAKTLNSAASDADHVPSVIDSDRHWDESGVNPTLNQCNAGSGTIGASNQELFAQNFNGLVTSIGETGKGFYNEQKIAQTLEAHEDQHRRNIVFWNGNDCAEALTCTSDRQLMPDKARLQCVIEQNQASGVSFEINYGCPVENEIAHTLKCGTAPGTYSGVIENNNITAFNGAGDASGSVTPTLQANLGKLLSNQTPIVCEGSKYYQWHSPNISATEITDDCSPTIPAAMGMGGSNMTTPCFVSDLVCLNDQGGNVMSVEDDGNAGTLRANTHGNEQIVCGAFVGRQGSKAHGIGYSEDHAPTVRAEQEIDLVQTLKIRSGKEGGGKGCLVQDNISATLGCGNDQTLFVVHGAQPPINNTEHANALGCCNDGLENCVCQVASFMGGQGAKAGGIVYSEELSPTLKSDAGGNTVPDVITLNNKQFGQCEENLASTLLSTDYKEPQVVCYDNQTRARNPMPTGDVSCTMQAAMGEGGNNVPLIQCYKADSLVEYPTAMITGDHDNRPTDLTNLVQECYAVDQGGGKSSCSVSLELSPTLATTHGGEPVVQECYAIDSVHSNSMKSANPHSGFHKEEIAKTLDTSDPNPIKNQGGNMIVESVGLDGYNATLTGESSATLGVNCGMSTGRNGIVESIAFEPGIAKRDGGDSRFVEELSSTLRSNAGDNQVAAVIAIDGDKMGKAERKGGSGLGVSENEVMYTQTAKDVHAVCTKGNGDAFESDVHTSLSASGGGQAGQGYACARIASTVRRLLPIECERLMGFPDNHTRIPWKGLPEEDCPDSPRYKACGNSMCVNVMQWIGEQIQKVEDKHNV